MNNFKVTYRFLATDFKRKLELSREYRSLKERLEHLYRRFDIDKISDPPEAREVAEEIKKVNKRLEEILEGLTWCS